MASNYSTTDDEDRALQDAINASLRGSSSNPALKLENEVMTRSEAVVQPSPKRVNIDDRIKDMALRAADELPLVHQPGGDTWVFIDPPPMQPEQDQLDYARYIKRYEKPILVKKDSLTKHSQIFEKAFEPTAQFRVVRRRNLVKALRESNIKYVIDLTPPSEGEEAVYLMTELCCSEGVRLWYQAGEIWRVANTLVGGEEEYTSVKIQNSVPSFTTCTKANADTEAQTNAPQDWSPTPASPKSTITNTIMSLEYSPVRHRSAIERVLDALLGWDPKLDSAPKVWTTFAVAKYFDIKHSKLDDYIISWLRAYPNSYFLEVLPEVSLQIAEGLENYELARDTFAILVGEEALDNLRRARNPIINNKLTTYGRKKEDLPEHIRTRIEYASKSFLERITKEFAVFVGEDMLWIDALPEYRKLATHTQLELQEDVNLFKRILKEYVRGAIYRLLCVNYDTVPAQDLHHPGGKDLLPRVSRSDVWTNNLSINERVLSRTFWEALRSFSLFEGLTNLDIKKGWQHEWDTPKMSSLEKLEISRGTYREVSTLSLEHFCRSGNQWLRRNKPLPSFDLPIRSLPQEHASFKEPTARSADLIQSNDGLDDNQITHSYLRPTQPIDIQQPSRFNQDVFNNDSTSMPENRPLMQDRPGQWPFGAPRQGSALDVLRNMNGSLTSGGILRDNSHSSAQDRKIELGFQAPAEYSSWLQEQERNHAPVPQPDTTGQSKIPPLGHHNVSGYPAPQEFSSWTNENSDDLNRKQESETTGQSESPFTKYKDELDMNPEELDGLATLAMDHPEYTRRSTPPFFRDDDALFDDEYLAQRSNQPHTSQQNKVTVYPSQSNPNKFFDLKEFFSQASSHIKDFARTKLYNADQYVRPEPLEIGITNTLVCLQDSEWKYLPLWAGGNDDGSGGVFNDHVPMADLGFSTAGPDVHDGTTPASSSIASSEFEVISAHSDATSTFNTSMANNRGFSDHMHRGRVYAADSADSVSSHQDDDDNFTIVTDDDDEDHARMQMEAQERIEMAEEAAEKEARRIEKGRGKMEDENYADLFSSDDGDYGSDETDRAEYGDFEDVDMDESDDGIEDLVLV